ncbi:hypothetical protein Tco_0040041 [Tanacetum coccineum]
MNPLSNHSYGFTPIFFAQLPYTPNTSKKDYDFDKILDDLFRTGAKNMKRMGHDIVQDSIWEQNDDSEKDQKEDGDDGDTFDMSHLTNGGNTRCDDTVHHTRYKIIHFTIYK